MYYYTNASCEFLSTPSARRATAAFSAWPAGMSISIHALREEGDSYRSIKHRPWTHFYPRPPRGGRLLVRVKVAGVLKFLSTPSARRATSYLPGTAIVDLFLSTPSARRATPARARLQLPAQISIHALREEGDVGHGIVVHRSGISIHALREEGDAGAGKC